MKLKNIRLGQSAWYPSSHDGFMGPHKVQITGLQLRKPNLSVEIDFGCNERCWVDSRDVFSSKGQALKAK